MARTNDLISKAQQYKSLGDARAARDAIQRPQPVNVIAAPTITPDSDGRVIEGGVVDYTTPTVVGGDPIYESTSVASTPVIVSDPNSANTQLITPVVNAEPVTVTPQEPTITYTYYAYDDQGREQQITESQYEQLNKWATENTSKVKTYNVIPAEVINDSGGNWWINSEGQYEYIPATESAKARLNEINGIRSGSGLSAHSTLIIGASPSKEYSDKWYSTGGGNIGTGEDRVKVITSTPTTPVSTAGKDTLSSGSIKLAELNASSSVNNDASAISNTAQTAKATVVPKTTITPAVEQQSTAKSNPLISSVNLTPFVTPTLGYSSEEEKAAITGATQEFKTVDQQKAIDLNEAFGKTQIETDVRNYATSKAEMSGEVQPFRTVEQAKQDAIVEAATEWAGESKVKQAVADTYLATLDVQAVKDTVKAADEKVSSYLPTVSEIAEHRQKTIASLTSEETAKKYDDWMEKKKSDSAALTIASNLPIGIYEELREKPVSTALETGAWAAVGAVASPLIAGAGGAAKAIPVIGKVISSPFGEKAITTGGKVIEAGLAGMFVGVSAAEVTAANPDGSKPTLGLMSERAGRIIGGDVLPAVVGFGAGSAKTSKSLTREEASTEMITERQFKTLEGFETTEIKTLGREAKYTKVKTETVGENDLSKNAIDTFDSLVADPSGVREFDVKFTKTITETPRRGPTKTYTNEGETTARLGPRLDISASQQTLTGEPVVMSSKTGEVVMFGDTGGRLIQTRGKKIEGFEAQSFEIGESGESIIGYGYKEPRLPEYEFATRVENIRARPTEEITPSAKGYRENKPATTLDDFIDMEPTTTKGKIDVMMSDESAMLGGRTRSQEAVQILERVPRSEVMERSRASIILEEVEPKLIEKVSFREVAYPAAPSIFLVGGLAAESLLSGNTGDVMNTHIGILSAGIQTPDTIQKNSPFNNVKQSTRDSPILGLSGWNDVSIKQNNDVVNIPAPFTAVDTTTSVISDTANTEIIKPIIIEDIVNPPRPPDPSGRGRGGRTITPEPLIGLPDFGEAEYSDPFGTGVKYKNRTKRHYVMNPREFIMGKGRR